MPATKKTPAKKISKKVARNVAIKKSKRTRTEDTPSTAVAKTTRAGGKTVKRTSSAKQDSTAKAGKASAPTMSIDFHEGTDMKTAFEEVLKGGASRAEVSARLAAMWADNKTRNGNVKPVSTILNHVVRRAKANGYQIVQTWQVVPPNEESPVTADLTGAPVSTKKPAVKAVKKAAKRIRKS